ncbi:SRPBCC domain-containing protein [Polaribacter vadi]|uniref:SRPBCC domain-containing protein n=1 Tax=Polaribacter TaxID=52959 RepID=UPI001C09695B|nr:MULTISPECIES: SRPBCC domain-containing protein [Polaribacter]MBU3012322.1 SRPBCC domain-containing protein [Polaribacter vadi]MDO6742139.1 SRPBCC domain-containing protein [Polaribacter sp. 1_MG-2023]
MKEIIKVEKVKASHRKIYTDIIINASAEQVWSVIKDTNSYKKWAIFLTDIQGELKDGNKITAKFQLNPSKEKHNSIDHTIQVDEGKSFYWAEKGPMGICDNHHFIIEAIDNNTSKFIQKDELTKGATFLLGGYLSKIYVKGYQGFNQALKKEVEQRFN